METIYYDPSQHTTNGFDVTPGYVIRINIDHWSQDRVKRAPRLDFSVNTYCALILLNILRYTWKDLNAQTGGIRLFDQYEETIIAPEDLMPAAETLKRLAETITGEELYTDMKWSWTEDKEGNVDKEFRIVLDMLELKDGLMRLVQFIEDSTSEPSQSLQFWL